MPSSFSRQTKYFPKLITPQTVEELFVLFTFSKSRWQKYQINQNEMRIEIPKGNQNEIVNEVLIRSQLTNY